MRRDWSLDLPVACRHLLPTGDRRAFHQVIRTWRVPWIPSYGSAWLSLFTASPKFLRSRGPWSCTIPPSQQHSCLQSLRPPSLPGSEVSFPDAPVLSLTYLRSRGDLWSPALDLSRLSWVQ